ncbi:hypothetical protein N7462_010493 [Penicillium macrosclerotiorum]|uniref:uncharacterized protein n=1 Tax=Penicillium macrosclerotiorum TaxID=303699 RepID=UPI00254746B9|nr:uncharacterized protein N7462_010493 [Penicillium macrosclerotiorum]KAJ5669423.1 hypothetical protein N7462_010493 [Penicillium macrosclerotiorum]
MPPPITDLIGSSWQPFYIAESYTADLTLPMQPAPDDIVDQVDSVWNPSDRVPEKLSLTSSCQLPLAPKLALTMPRTRQSRPLSDIISSRLQFAIDVLKRTPSMMVLENRTPWCHPQLYKNYMPKAMQDAYACCSLYMSKNEINAPVIMSLLDARTQELLLSPQPTHFLDLLARTHALILFQIMRLFDGDIRSHTTANALLGTLESTVMALFDFTHLPNISESYNLLPMDPIFEFWESWVVQESARRTILLAFYFIQICKVLHGNVPMQCDGRLGLAHAWYLSSHLWDAQSAFDFAIAWAEKQHFVVHDLDFSFALENANPDDMDLFGKMLLVTILGIDEAKAWFCLRGAVM